MAKCRHCKTKLAEGEGVRVGLSIYCSKDHAIDWAAQKSHSDFKKDCSADRREYNRRKPKWQHAQTQPVFNRMRVLEELKWFDDRGLNPTCISCGLPLGNDVWCCGHFKTVGAKAGLRYDRMNSYLQHNQRCNMQMSGDIGGSANTMGYKAGLVHRFGEDEGNRIIEYCSSNDGLSGLAWQDIEEMRKEFNFIIRELKR